MCKVVPSRVESRAGEGEGERVHRPSVRPSVRRPLGILGQTQIPQEKLTINWQKEIAAMEGRLIHSGGFLI